MSSAAAFFLLSGISLILWIQPGGRVLLTASEMGGVMTIEGIVLFFCAVLSAHIRNTILKADGRDEGMARIGLSIAVLGAFGIGGALASWLGGRELLLTYVLSMILHVHGSLRLSEREMLVEAAVNLHGFLVFLLLGLLAYKAPLPSFGDSYPLILPGHKLQLEGHRMLAWACACFAVLGCMHLVKRRQFAQVLQAKDPE